MKRRSDDELKAALGRYGYPLLQPEGRETGAVLVGLAESRDTRVLEGFPVVLANVLMQEKSEVDLSRLAGRLSNPKSRELFWQLVCLSVYLFDLYGLDVLKSKLRKASLARLRRYDRLRDDLANSKPLELSGRRLDLNRLKKTFLEYLARNVALREGGEDQRAKLDEEFRKEYLLAFVLSPVQKDLVYKRLRGKAMTKTEREYFSRVVKKKLLALADPDLHRLAQRALQ